MDLLYLLIAGLIGGFFAGLLGIGGGIIYVAILPYALKPYSLDDETLVAAVIANSILATFFAALSSLHRQYVHKNLFVKESLYLGIPGAITVIAFFALVVEKGYFKFQYFNILIVSIMLLMLLRNLLMSKRQSQKEKTGSFPGYFLIGTSGGILSAFSGLGGGAIVVPMLVSILKMDIKKATSVSMGFILLTSFGMSAYNFLFSDLNISGSLNGVIIADIIFPLIIGVLIAAPIGVKTANKISSRLLLMIFISFIVLVMMTRLYDLLK